VERVRDARVAPVEEQVPAIANEDVAVVEIVMLDGVRDATGGELLAEAIEFVQSVDQRSMVVRREAHLPPQQERFRFLRSPPKVGAEGTQRSIGNAERGQLIAVGCRLDLKLGVLRQQRTPVIQERSQVACLAQADAGVAAQHPAAIPISGEDFGSLGWTQPGQERGEPHLEGAIRLYRLEPTVAGAGRDA
jgi:hypothetical protein